MSRIHAVPWQEALNALLCMTCWGRDRHVDLIERDPRTMAVQHRWHDVDGRRGRAVLVRSVQRVDELFSPELELTLPRKERGWGTVRSATVLWAKVEGTEQLRRAKQFRPLPSLIIREGASSRRTLLWALEQELGWEDVTRANKRLAYRLGAPQKWAEPERLEIPVPGSCLRVQRKRPVPVVAARCSYETFKASQLVKRLKDPPEQTWRERAG